MKSRLGSMPSHRADKTANCHGSGQVSLGDIKGISLRVIICFHFELSFQNLLSISSALKNETELGWTKRNLDTRLATSELKATAYPGKPLRYEFKFVAKAFRFRLTKMFPLRLDKGFSFHKDSVPRVFP